MLVLQGAIQINSLRGDESDSKTVEKSPKSGCNLIAVASVAALCLSDVRARAEDGNKEEAATVVCAVGNEK